MRFNVASFVRCTLFALAISSTTGCGATVVVDDDRTHGDGGSGGLGGGGSSSTFSNSSNSKSSNSSTTSGPITGCVNPTEIVSVDGFETGYVRCSDGSVDRSKQGQCSYDFDYAPCLGNEDFTDECLQDADCGGPGSHCVHSKAIEGGTWCQCQYGCEIDDDCGPGYACVCGAMLDTLPVATCAPIGCTVDSDCVSGECGVGTFDDCGSRQTYLTCRGPADACRIDVDCNPPGECSATAPGASFDCQVPTCPE